MSTVSRRMSASPTPRSRSRGRNVLGQVRVPVPAVEDELAVVADVLRQQDPVAVAAREQLQDELDDARLALALHRA